MKYHINFDSEHRLSFEILDNPVAQAWTSIMQSEMSNDNLKQIITNHAFPAHRERIQHPLNQIIHLYKEIISLDIPVEFDLKKNFLSYNDQDFIILSNDVDQLYYKVITHNFYYGYENNTALRACVSKIMRYKEELLDTKFNPDENYAVIRTTDSNNKIHITDDMRKQYWVETERPTLVIRAWPDYDLKSLDTIEKRNIVTNSNYMRYITSAYKICYYHDDLTSVEATEYMKERRNKILDFVLRHKINSVPGDLKHYNFVPPVIAHCINDNDFTDEQLEILFCSEQQFTITSEFEE